MFSSRKKGPDLVGMHVDRMPELDDLLAWAERGITSEENARITAALLAQHPDRMFIIALDPELKADRRPQQNYLNPRSKKVKQI